MKNKILIPLLVVGALAAFFSFRYGAFEGEEGTRKTITLETVMATINRGHFEPRKIDDSFSAAIFKKAINSLDYRKNFFTQEDVNSLSKYEYQIDDQINSGSVAFFEELDKLFSKRIDQTETYYKEILKTPFSFEANDSVELDGDNLAYAADDAALRTRWEKYLKYQTLSKYVDLKKAQEAKKEKKIKMHLRTRPTRN